MSRAPRRERIDFLITEVSVQIRPIHAFDPVHCLVRKKTSPIMLLPTFENVSLPILIAVFAAVAAIIWLAGIYLSDSTDLLSTRWGMGEALGGLILLSVATNLPELAITASGALHHDLGIAVGNILGGIAIQTVVLAVLDVVGVGKSAPLTYRSASLTLVLEGALVIAVLTVCIMGTQLPASLIFAHITPDGLAIMMLWIGGLWLIGKSRTELQWQDEKHAPDSQDEWRGYVKLKKLQVARNRNVSTARSVAMFAIAALVTLVCGVVLEQTGSAIAKQIGMNGMLFGATALAAATALPELSTGLSSIKLGDYQLAVSDIFGGNAFLPVLFLLATLLSGEAVLPHAQKADIYLTALGILLTVVYVTGLIFRSRMQIACMGLDSFAVVVFYVVGIIGLFAIAGGSI